MVEWILAVEHQNQLYCVDCADDEYLNFDPAFREAEEELANKRGLASFQGWAGSPQRMALPIYARSETRLPFQCSVCKQGINPRTGRTFRLRSKGPTGEARRRILARHENRYATSVAHLLLWGEPEHDVDKWSVYKRCGFRLRHVPELIRMATDARSLEGVQDTDEDGHDAWAPLHAWRALGLLRAAQAIEPLLQVLATEDDSAIEELPEVYARIGPDAIPALAAFLTFEQHGDAAREGAATSLTRIAEEYPDVHSTCVAILANQLAKHPANSRWLNADLVWQLLDLGATDAAPVMEAAFAAGHVDERIARTWEDVKTELSLWEIPFTPPDDSGPAHTIPLWKARATRKQKNKLAKASRKKNRQR